MTKMQNMNNIILKSVILLNVMAPIWGNVAELRRGAQNLTGGNLKVVWAEFSTLSWAVLI